MLALRHLEAEEEANRCPVCGGDSRECQDPKNQNAFEANFKRCYVTRNLITAMKGREDDPHERALVPLTLYHPERRKT